MRDGKGELPTLYSSMPSPIDRNTGLSGLKTSGK